MEFLQHEKYTHKKRGSLFASKVRLYFTDKHRHRSITMLFTIGSQIAKEMGIKTGDKFILFYTPGKNPVFKLEKTTEYTGKAYTAIKACANLSYRISCTLQKDQVTLDEKYRHAQVTESKIENNFLIIYT